MSTPSSRLACNFTFRLHEFHRLGAQSFVVPQKFTSHLSVVAGAAAAEEAAASQEASAAEEAPAAHEHEGAATHGHSEDGDGCNTPASKRASKLSTPQAALVVALIH